jgi:hypothetical protein
MSSAHQPVLDPPVSHEPGRAVGRRKTVCNVSVANGVNVYPYIKMRLVRGDVGSSNVDAEDGSSFQTAPE